MVEDLIGKVLHVGDATRLPACVLPLMYTAEGRAELAALAEASPFAAWHEGTGMFACGYVYSFLDEPPHLLVFTDEGRQSLWVMPSASRGARLVSLRLAAGQLVARLEADPAAQERVYVSFQGLAGVLEVGRRYDLVHQLQDASPRPMFVPVELRPVD